MNILAIMLHWYPYEGPLMPIYSTIFNELMAKGHKITIVTSFPHYRQGRPETWKEFRGKFFQKTTWEGATLIRSYVFAPVFKNSKLALFYRALNFISFNISCIIAGLFMTGKQDLIFAPSSPPLTNGICAYIIALFKKIPMIYNIQDIYPDMAIKLGILKNNVVIKIMRLVENFVYRKANKVIVISKEMKRNLISKKIKNYKIEIIPNFVDTSFIKPMEKKNEFSLRFGLHNKFVVMYAGNIGLPHGLEFVVESAERLAKNLDIIFAFVARGEYKDKIKSLCKSKNLENVIFIPQQPEHKVPQIWASADVSLITYRKYLAECSLPSKLFAIMASSRPVITMVDEGCDIWRIVENAECGICIPPENPELLEQAILNLYKDNKKRIRMSNNGRKHLMNNFSHELISQKFEASFLKAINSR